jgi:hypothetical protein
MWSGFKAPIQPSNLGVEFPRLKNFRLQNSSDIEDLPTTKLQLNPRSNTAHRTKRGFVWTTAFARPH